MIPKEGIAELPYISLDCGSKNDCSFKFWVRGILEAGEVAYYSFPRAGEEASTFGQYNKEQPVVWTRRKYFEVADPQKVAALKVDGSLSRN